MDMTSGVLPIAMWTCSLDVTLSVAMKLAVALCHYLDKKNCHMQAIELKEPVQVNSKEYWKSNDVFLGGAFHACCPGWQQQQTRKNAALLRTPARPATSMF
jgi:hypothetical protein